MSANGNPVSGIFFGDIEKLYAYIEEKFGKRQLEAAQKGTPNDIVMSFIYFPKVNDFRGVEELQFEIQYYQ